MIRLLVFTACTLSIASQAAPVLNINDQPEQALVHDTSLASSEALFQSQSPPSSSDSPTKFWIDEFDTLVPYKNARSEPRSTNTRRHTGFLFVSSALQPVESQFIDDTRPSFYKAYLASYMDLMSSFSDRLDLNHEYIQGFSFAASILVFVGLGAIVFYLVALPAWRRRRSRSASLGHASESSRSLL